MRNGSPHRKIDLLFNHMENGRWKEALALAARWPRLGAQKNAIIMGHEAACHPDFYRQIGKNPDELVEEGKKALETRYGHLMTSSD